MTINYYIVLLNVLVHCDGIQYVQESDFVSSLDTSCSNSQVSAISVSERFGSVSSMQEIFGIVLTKKRLVQAIIETDHFSVGFFGAVSSSP